MKKIYLCIVLALLLSLVAPFGVSAGEVNQATRVASSGPVVTHGGYCPFRVYTPNPGNPEKYHLFYLQSMFPDKHTISALLVSPPNERAVKTFRCTGRWDPWFAGTAWYFYGTWLSQGVPVVFDNSNTTDSFLGDPFTPPFDIGDIQFKFTVYPDGTYKFVAQLFER